MAPLGAEKKRKRDKFRERFSSKSTTTAHEEKNSDTNSNIPEFTLNTRHSQSTLAVQSTQSARVSQSSQSTLNTGSTFDTRNTSDSRSDPNTESILSTQNTQNTQITDTTNNRKKRKRKNRKSRRECKVERIMKELGINEHNPTSTPLEEGPQMAINYSVFYGNPTPADQSLGHFLINTTVTEEFLEVGQNTRNTDEKLGADDVKPGYGLTVSKKLLNPRQNTRNKEKPRADDTNLKDDLTASKENLNNDQNTRNENEKPLADDANSGNDLAASMEPLSIGQNTRNEDKPCAKDTSPGNDLTVSKCLASLATRYSNQILELPPQLCSVCRKASPEAVVHRTLYWTLDGYASQDDGPVMASFMRQIAAHVKSLNTKEKMSKALGDMGQGPYIHEMAAVVCCEESECHNVATRNIENFMKENMKKARASLHAAKKLSGAMSEVQISGQVLDNKDLSDKAMVYVNEAGWELVDDDDNDDGKSLFPRAASYVEAGMVAAPNDLVKFRLSVFCGRPILDPNTPPRRGRISSLVFTSKWPTSFASGGAGKLYEQEYQNYRVIAGFHNQHILQAANFHCVMCADEKPAKELVHHLISFKRDNTIGAQSDGIKKSVMKLFQFVEGRWKYKEMNAALSPDGRCHINEWVVPICSRNSNCEGLARLAVKEAMKRLMPEDVRPHYLDMFRDTVFSRPFPQVQGGKYPKAVVKKLAGGIADDEGNVMLEAPGPKILDKEVDVFFKQMRVLVDVERKKRRAEAAKREKEAAAKGKDGDEEK